MIITIKIITIIIKIITIIIQIITQIITIIIKIIIMLTCLVQATFGIGFPWARHSNVIVEPERTTNFPLEGCACEIMMMMMMMMNNEEC